MNRTETRRLMIMMQQQLYEEKRYDFLALGKGGQYTEAQKHFAFELISEYGIRATARILKIPRRTLQRWCIKYNIYVRLYPPWMHDWAERRRKRKEFWARRGYY